MNATNTLEREDLLAAILSEETFRPAEPSSLEETGVPISLIESLLIKHLNMAGVSTGRRLAEAICLPFRILEEIFQVLRSRQLIVHKSSAPFNDYAYTLTENGRKTAQIAMRASAYVGPVPVPLGDYVLSTDAQSIRAECPKRTELREAFGEISVNETLFETLGPAINSGAGMFLYGEPGNGKSTLAKCITRCFGQRIWIPHALIEGGHIIKLYDPAIHEPEGADDSSIIRSASFDRRWVKIKRPTVVVGGELTMESLEIRHDAAAHVSEAPVQLKSNCGCLLIDDFGRQRIEPAALLNRWIVPLESRVDFLTLPSGKKIEVPFEQLIIFSTNLEPSDLVDEAFLRRIPYKIEVEDPSEEEFQELFELYAGQFGCEYRPDVVEHLLDKHYRPLQRRRRRCHPRDLLTQVRNYCSYNDLEMSMDRDILDRIVKSYFTAVLKL